MSSVCHPLPPLLRPVDFWAPSSCTTPIYASYVFLHSTSHHFFSVIGW
jgi:hypothetical protein